MRRIGESSRHCRRRVPTFPRKPPLGSHAGKGELVGKGDIPARRSVAADQAPRARESRSRGARARARTVPHRTAAHAHTGAQARPPPRTRREAWKVPAGSRSKRSQRGGGSRVGGGRSAAAGGFRPERPAARLRSVAPPGPESGGRGGAREGRGRVPAASAFKPGLARPERAVAAREPSGPVGQPVSSSARVSPPPSGVPGAGSVRKPRAVHSGMPRYELALILKAMQRPETAAALKRTLEALMDRGAVVRSLENLGERALPYKMSAHSQQHTRGGYFLVDFYAPTTTVESIMEHLSRDIDVIRPNVVKHPLTQEVKECEGIVPVPLEEKLYSTKKRK
ncbi:28S ribosomal protein S6, mitochondrial [Moschus berezovskii]|nr:28S ribosomal protein S6, mitochondrial [Moschus berezovskii]